MNLFAERLTDRIIFGWEMPASWLQSVPALFIILFAPVFSALWLWLGSRSPSIPAKFALGLIQLGLSFVIMAWASTIATGGTLVNACRLLREQGASKVYVACSLPFFNGNAVEKLSRAHEEGLFEMVVGTDAVWRGPEFGKAHPWYREVSVARLFAQVIFNINRRRSVSELLK